jgi:hypothetical protein
MTVNRQPYFVFSCAFLGATVYTQVELPPLIPPYKGGRPESSSLPFIRGGLGWGKTLVNQLFPTCVYTVAL